MQRGLDVGAAQHRRQLLLDVFGLAFLDHQHRLFAHAKIAQLLGNQRVGGVEHQQGDVGLPEGVGQAKLLQRADQRVVEAALNDDAELAVFAVKQLVEAVVQNVLARGGQAFVALELFVAEGHRRMRQAHVVEARGFGDQVLGGELRGDVVLAFKTAAHMAGADAQLQNAGHVGGL